MESAVPMLLFLGGLFFFGLLILVCGYQSRQLERGEVKGNPLAARDVHGTARFFAPVQSGGIFDESAEKLYQRCLESYLADQRPFADRFVDEPSVETLLCRSEFETPATISFRLECFLRKEQRAVAAFLSEPSVERLLRTEPELVAA